MKIFGLSLIMLFLVSCVVDECYDCSEFFNWDDADKSTDTDSDVLEDNDDPVAQPDTGSEENGNGGSETPDEGSEVPDNGNGEAPDENGQNSGAECGNGIVESGEICDGNKMPCYDLSPDYIGGEATCKDDCLGWDTEYCIEPQPDEPIASIPPKTFTVEYLYNGVDAFNNGANQDNELWASPLFSTSITLTTGTYYIPHNLSDAHWLAGFYDAQTVQFVQQSFVLSSGSFTLPYVVMGALRSAVVKDAVLSIGITDENEVNFVVFDMMSSVDCVILVGYGSLTVNGINIAQGHAGLFEFSTSKIDLYLPADTPEGNMIPEIQSAGFTVCQ